MHLVILQQVNQLAQLAIVCSIGNRFLIGRDSFLAHTAQRQLLPRVRLCKRLAAGFTGWPSDRQDSGNACLTNRQARNICQGLTTNTAVGREYSGEKVGDGIQQKEGMEQPVYYWDPVISPSGICFYKGDAIPEWKNNLFIAALSGQHVDRLVIENNKVTGEERLLADKNTRFRDVTYLDNKLYALTDGGDIYRISKQ